MFRQNFRELLYASVAALMEPRRSIRPKNWVMVRCKRPVSSLLKFSALFVLLGHVLCVSALEAQGESRDRGPRTLSVHQAIAFALQRNLSLADARLQVRKKEHARRAAFSDFFPTVDLKYSATADKYRNVDNIEDFYMQHDGRWQWRGDGSVLYPDYPYRIDPFRTFTFSATLTQPVFSGGRLPAKYELARLGVDLARVQRQITRQNLILNVIEAYYQLVLAEKLLDIADESIRALKALRRQSQAMFKAHLVLKVDVLSIKTRLAQEELQRSRALGDIAKKRAILNFLMRNPQGTPFQTIRELRYEPVNYKIPQIFSIAAANRLEIREADISVQEALATIKVDQAGLMPELSVEIEGSRTNDDWNPFDPEANNDWSIEGVLTWTFDMFRRRETVKKDRISHAQKFVMKNQLVEKIMSEVMQAYAAVKRYERDIRYSRRAAKFSRENFRANKELYDGQMASYLEIVTAQAQMSETNRDYYRTLAGHRISRAVLERRMGILR